MNRSRVVRVHPLFVEEMDWYKKNNQCRGTVEATGLIARLLKQQRLGLALVGQVKAKKRREATDFGINFFRIS